MPNIQRIIQKNCLSNMQNLASYTTSNFELFPEIIGQFMLDNSGTIDSRAIVKLPLKSMYESNEAVKSNVVTTNYLIKTFLYQKQPVTSDQVFGETYYYHDNTLVNKILKLVDNIGVKLFSRLDDKDKLLMARTAGCIEFANKIDIDSVYNYLENYES